MALPPGFRQLPSFAVSSAAVVLALAGVVAFLFKEESNRALIAETERDGIVLANMIRNSQGGAIHRLVSDAVGEDAESIRALSSQSVLRSGFVDLAAGTPVVELKVYDSGGTVVYAGDPAEIGHSAASHPDFLSAMLERGASRQVLRGNATVVVTSLPLVIDGHRRLGVLEIQTDISDSLERIAARSLVVGGKSMGFLAALWLVLLAIVARGDRVLRHQGEELARLAGTDELTGLANRRQLWGMASREFQRALRHGRPLSVIIMDIDRFKMVNDTFGHAVGDQAIRALGDAIARNLRTTDLAARLGGDEFLLLLPETDAAGAAGLAERLAAEMDILRLVSMGGQRISCSLGLAEAIEGLDVTFDDLVARADGALYAAKRGGRARYELHVPVPARDAV
ncbi:MAG: GGDEF domain-containing protein [Magnetospirillum sp. WYHS-4]